MNNIPTQSTYDAFNSLIFSDNLSILAKLIARKQMLELVKDIPGDVVELGVFKGSGLATFLKLRDIMFPKICSMKVIGFDFFNTEALIDSLQGNDKKEMESLFVDRKFKHENSFLNSLSQTFKTMGYTEQDYELVKGDVNLTVSEFIKQRPGFRARLVYFDLDLEEPTYNALNALWDKVSPGGVVVFDEAGLHQWSESNGIDKFFAGKNLKLTSTNLPCPTAYIVKPNF